jgi:hypothetical protein
MMKYTELPNKHDNIPNWDKFLQEEKKSNRIKYLESELAAKDRLDGYVLAGFMEELKILKNEKDN